MKRDAIKTTADGKPASKDDLKVLFDRLAEDDHARINEANLGKVFESLIEIYEDEDEDYPNLPLPVTYGEVMSIYEKLLKSFGGRPYSLPEKDNSAPATVDDLLVLLYTVDEHFNSKTGQIEDLDTSDRNALMTLFDKLSGHYTETMTEAHNSGAHSVPAHKKIEKLTKDYDDLAEFFGKPSDYVLMQDEIDEMYELMEAGELDQVRMEGEMIQGFEDLLSVERSQRDGRISDLMERLDELEDDEMEAEGYIEGLQEET